MSITQFNTQIKSKLPKSANQPATPTSNGIAAFQKKTSPVQSNSASAGVLEMQKALRNMQGEQKRKNLDSAYNNYLQKSSAVTPASTVQPVVATPSFSNDIDYAAQMRQLASTPVTAEGQKQMRQLAAAREAKILAGGESMAQYANDDVSKMAQNYMRQYVPAATDMSAYYDKADALAQQMYDENVASLEKQNAAQLENLRQNYDKARREAALAYAMQSRGMENVLAEQGIGRGLGAAPSSGYSETARLGALSDYANNINHTYQQQDAATRELAAQLEAARLQAMMQRYSAMMENQYARAEQANADRNYGLNVHQFNTGLDQFDRQLGETVRGNDIAEKQANADIAIALNADKRANDLLPGQLYGLYLDNVGKGYANEAQAISNKWAPQFNEAEYDSILAGTANTKASTAKINSSGYSGGGGGSGNGNKTAYDAAVEALLGEQDAPGLYSVPGLAGYTFVR